MVIHLRANLGIPLGEVMYISTIMSMVRVITKFHEYISSPNSGFCLLSDNSAPLVKIEMLC